MGINVGKEIKHGCEKYLMLVTLSETPLVLFKNFVTSLLRDPAANEYSLHVHGTVGYHDRTKKVAYHD